MTREEMASEISYRRSIPFEDVEEVLEEEDFIAIEELTAMKKKKKVCILVSVIIFLAGVITALIVLDRKEKINAQQLIKNYTDTAKLYSDKMMKKVNDLQNKIQQLM